MTARCLVMALAVLTPAPGLAFDAEDLARFVATGSCPGCDLSGALLSPDPGVLAAQGAGDLSGADMRGASLMFDPVGFDLAGADLRDAEAFYTGFSQADLTGARLTGLLTYGTGFDDAILRGADLSGTSFDASFAGADLTGADLSGASFSMLAGFTAEQLAAACGDARTDIPGGMTVPPC